MAFSDLKPVKIFDDASGSTFIIGDVFAVHTFGTPYPVIYSWDQVINVTEDKKNITITAGSGKYFISKKLFTLREDYFRAIALIECAFKKYNFLYEHENRVLPLKSSYIECTPGTDAYIGQGVIDPNDAAATFIMMMNMKIVKVLWLVAVLIVLITFAGLHFFIGITRDNILYFIPISVATGGIIALIVYFICYSIARGRFQSVIGSDPSMDEACTFVISQFGFAACENCIYEGRDIVPWSCADYFVETDKLYIFYKNSSPFLYIPKKAFEKKYLSGISDLIALKLEQK